MKKTIFLKLFLFHFLFLICINFLHASETYKDHNNIKERFIILVHQKSKKVVFINKGESINFRIHKNKFQGQIDSISDHSFFVDDNEFEFSEISFIYKGATFKSAKKMALISLSSGLFISISGFVILKNRGRLGSGTLYMFYYIVPGLSFILFGSLILIKKTFAGYSLKKRWKMESLLK